MKIKGRESRESGTFAVSADKEIYGELELAGPKTSLFLHDKNFFNPLGIHTLNGVLQDRTKVTLIDCISSGPGSGGSAQERYHFARIFPHYVLYGCHLPPDQELIGEARFFVDDATTIFYDYEAFGSLIHAEPFIAQIIAADNPERKAVTGNNPQILYFAGKHEILSAETAFGQLVFSHVLNMNPGSPAGVGIKNKIAATITFERLLKFEEAIVRVWTLTEFLGLLAGRPQNLLSLSVRLGNGNTRTIRHDVYWSMPPRRHKRLDAREPHPADIPLDALGKPGEFSTVVCNWLARQATWRDARARFFSSFAKQGSYGIDRLIAAANMFDILPSSAVPKDVQLTDELKVAKASALELFRSLPNSAERESALSVLGRLGKANLKHKVRHRAQLVLDKVGDRFPGLLRITDEAVNCRNHYVHGTLGRINYTERFELVHVFIDTLEFVFAASDLIECGWDITAWNNKITGISHPFGRFRVAYTEMLGTFERLLQRFAPPAPEETT